MKENKSSGTAEKNSNLNLEIMTKMMLMKNSKTTGYTDNVHYYKKIVPNISR